MLHRVLRGLVENALTPAFDCRIFRDGKVVFRERFPDKGPELFFDTASLTKPLITFLLVYQHFTKVDFPLTTVLPEAGIQASLLELLSHRAGLKPWLPLYLFGESYLESIRLRGQNPAGRTDNPVYSCLGYILLSRAIAKAAGTSFRQIAKAFLAGFPGCEINPGPRPDVAPTEFGNEYERKLAEKFVEDPDPSRFRPGLEIHGETHDLNAFYDGGISGNAGLFATAAGTMELLQALIQMENASLPLMKGDGYFYHLGFTGTGIAVSEDRRIAVAFLSNRVHPVVLPGDFSAVRHRIFRAAMEMFS
ncbi:MAG: serine hydrolase [Acidobacteria bacterium]|nr:serine hydrolase [Acidobacteriota bacterium]